MGIYDSWQQAFEAFICIKKKKLQSLWWLHAAVLPRGRWHVLSRSLCLFLLFFLSSATNALVNNYAGICVNPRVKIKSVEDFFTCDLASLRTERGGVDGAGGGRRWGRPTGLTAAGECGKERGFKCGRRPAIFGESYPIKRPCLGLRCIKQGSTPFVSACSPRVSLPLRNGDISPIRSRQFLIVATVKTKNEVFCRIPSLSQVNQTSAETKS